MQSADVRTANRNDMVDFVARRAHAVDRPKFFSIGPWRPLLPETSAPGVRAGVDELPVCRFPCALIFAFSILRLPVPRLLATFSEYRIDRVPCSVRRVLALPTVRAIPLRVFRPSSELADRLNPAARSATQVRPAISFCCQADLRRFPVKSPLRGTGNIPPRRGTAGKCPNGARKKSRLVDPVVRSRRLFGRWLRGGTRARGGRTSGRHCAWATRVVRVAAGVGFPGVLYRVLPFCRKSSQNFKNFYKFQKFTVNVCRGRKARPRGFWGYPRA